MLPGTLLGRPVSCGSPRFLDLCCRSGDATWEKASLESMPLRPKSIHATSPPLLMEPPPVRQCRSYLGDIVIDLHCCRRFDDIAIDPTISLSTR